MKKNITAETPAISVKKEGRVKQHTSKEDVKPVIISATGKLNKVYERYTKNRMMRLKALERKQDAFVARVQKEFPEMKKEEILTFWNKHNKPQPKRTSETKPYWSKQSLAVKQNLEQLRKDRTKTIEFVDNNGITRIRKIILNVVRVYNKKQRTFTWSIEEAKKRFEERASRRAERLIMRQKLVIEENNKKVDKPKVRKNNIWVITRRATEDGKGVYDFNSQPAQNKKAAEKIAMSIYSKYNGIDSSFDSVICAEFDTDKKINVPFKVIKKDSIELPKESVTEKKHYVPMTISSKKEEKIFTEPSEILAILEKNPSGTIKNLPLSIKREVSRYGYNKTIDKYKTLINNAA